MGKAFASFCINAWRVIKHVNLKNSENGNLELEAQRSFGSVTIRFSLSSKLLQKNEVWQAALSR